MPENSLMITERRIRIAEKKFNSLKLFFCNNFRINNYLSNSRKFKFFVKFILLEMQENLQFANNIGFKSLASKRFSLGIFLV